MEIDLVSSDDSLPPMLDLSRKFDYEVLVVSDDDDEKCTLNTAVYELSSSSEEIRKEIEIPIRRDVTQVKKDEKRRKMEENRKARNEAKINRNIEIERKKLLKKIENDKNRNFKPDQSIKFITVVIDRNLMDISMGPVLTSLLESVNIKYEIKQMDIPNCITWKSESIETTLSQEMEIEIDKNDKDENEILVYLPLEQFLNYVKAFKEKNIDCDTLNSRAKSIKKIFPTKNITFIIEGYEKYMRSLKSTNQNKFREKVLESNNPSTTNKRGKKINISISDIEVQECIVALLIEESCNVRIEISIADVATQIFSMTKSISAAPFKRAKYNNQQFLQTVDNCSGVKVKDSGQGLDVLWQKYIETFKMVNSDISRAITNKYQTPKELLRAYDGCLCDSEREKLVEDLMVRRGVGPLVGTRRVGPELSRKLFLQFTSFNPDLHL